MFYEQVQPDTVARELGVLGVLQPPLLQVLHPLPHVGVTPKKVQNRKRPKAPCILQGGVGSIPPFR